jgi:hypothetical protein
MGCSREHRLVNAQCPACGSAAATTTVAAWFAASADSAPVGPDWRSVGYADLVRAALAFPQPPAPPPPPLPPIALELRSTLGMLTFWRSNLTATIAVTGVAAATFYGMGRLGGVFADIVSWFVLAAFAASIAVPARRWYRVRRVAGKWQRIRKAREDAVAAAQAAYARARDRAAAGWSSGHYCHACIACFWPGSQSEALPPERFRAELARLGDYARLGQQYSAAYGALPTTTGETPPVTIGDITVTEATISTPSGSMPSSGAQWRLAQTHAETREVRPVWAIALAALFAPVCGLGFLFLLVKRGRLVSYLSVTVANPHVSHQTRVVVASPLEKFVLESKLDYATLVASRCSQLG